MSLSVKLEYRILDLGCGAGFGGLVLALLFPEARIFLLDSDRKKINFVRQVIRELHLKNAQTLLGRAEDLQSEYPNDFDFVFSRATWKIPEFLKNAQNYVQNNGHVLYMGGPQAEKTSKNLLTKQAFKEPIFFFYQIKPKNYQRQIFSFQK